jgi:hypothetical protein
MVTVSSEVISGFTSDEEDFFEAGSVARRLLAEEPLERARKGKRTNREGWEVDTSPAPVKRRSMVSAGAEIYSKAVHADVPISTDLQQILGNLQDQLFNISTTLSSTVEGTGHETSERIIKLVALQRKYDDLLLTNETLRANMACLRTSMDRVQTAHTKLAAELTRMVDEQELNRKPDERSRASIGIDPWIIQDLAADLSTGRDPTEVASELFTLAESAISYPTGPEDIKREALAPRERLRNLEGIMDVSLGRLETLEERYRQVRGGGNG